MYTKRQIKIIEYIINNVSGITGEKLARYLGVSSRTIRNDILMINSALNGTLSIKASKRNGYYITQNEIDGFKSIVRGGDEERNFIAPHNRGCAILGHVLEEGNISLYDLEEELFLSQTALREEVCKLKKLLESRMEAPVVLLEGSTVRISREEDKVRLAIFNMIQYEEQVHPGGGGGSLELLFPKQFSECEYRRFVSAVKNYFCSHDITVSDASLYLVANAVYATLLRKRQGHELKEIRADNFMVEVLSSLLFHLKAQKIELSESDEALLKMFLYSVRLVQSPESNRASALCGVILKAFCQEVMNKYSFDLRQSDALFDNMALHLEYLIRRIDTGYRIDNPILQDIKTQYPYAYEIAILLVPIIFRYKGIPIRDEEIAYMALYVAYFLEKVNRRLKAVVISSTRQSVYVMVCRWIEDYFQNQIEIVKVLPAHQLELYLESQAVDLVITTDGQRVCAEFPVFCLNGIPDQQDYQALNGFIRRIRMSKRFNGIVDKYFDRQRIRIFKEAAALDEVIAALAGKFKEQDKIDNTEEYVEDVLSREINYPTVIGESVMIPHPLMTFAKETSVAVAVLRRPITVCKKAVKLIFLLAIEGRPNDDVSILFEFFKQVAMNENLVHILYETKDEEDFLSRLITISTSIELS